MFPLQGFVYIILVQIGFIWLNCTVGNSGALHVSAHSQQPEKNVGSGFTFPRASKGTACKEVLTKNLECPSIGAYPVAGVCDYFVRCIQTENGVESEVDFCPDGQVYIGNRCVKSAKDECPQKSCRQGHYATTTEIVVTKRIPLPEDAIRPKPKPIMPKPGPISTYKPFLNLHPMINGARVNLCSLNVFLILLSIMIVINF